MKRRIAITGMGICCAAGRGLRAFADSLKRGESGIKERHGVFSHGTVWAGLADVLEPIPPGADRAGVLALEAAHEASGDSREFLGSLDKHRIGLILGTSHGGRSQIDSCLDSVEMLESPAAADRVINVSPHFFQTEWVARQLGICGPVSTVSTACSSSSAAVLHAKDLLEAGKVDAVIAGGMDGFSKLTHAGFSALGAVAQGACGPFSGQIGISLGEGAAVVLLETLERAQARGARVWAELYGAGSSWDCYHLTEPHPSGEGMLRALNMAASRAGLCDLREIGYAGLHGTGTRANDASETIALKRFFDGAVPPASSIKSFTGHTLGASGVMALIAAVLGMDEGFLPPTANFNSPRPGCDLDYIPNEARPAAIRCFTAQSAGFGGVNVALVAGRSRGAAVHSGAKDLNDTFVALTGMGIVSPSGIGVTQFRESLKWAKSGIGPIERFDVSGCRNRCAGLVRDFFPRRLAPTLDLRRADLCFQFAAVAVSEALAKSRLWERGIPAERVGLVAATTRGAVSSFERCMRSAVGGAWQQTSALAFPNLVMSSLGGYLSTIFKTMGAASTFVCPAGGGLQAIIHALQALRSNETQDAVIVVLADEISPLFYRFFDHAGQAAASHRFLGEGSVALVLEKVSEAAALAEDALLLSGSGMTFDACAGACFAESVRQAISESGVSPSDVDLIFGHGDDRETSVFKRLFDGSAPVSRILQNTGFAETASAGFTLVAAALSLQHQEVYLASAGGCSSRNMRTALLAASSDSGSNGALLLRREYHSQGNTLQ